MGGRREGPAAGADSPLDRHLGSRLRALRDGLGMDEAQAAAALHVSVAALRGYEAGQGRLTALRLLQFVGLLGAPLTALFTQASRETAQTVLSTVRQMGSGEEAIRPDQRELLEFLHAWLAVSDEGQRARMVAALAIAEDGD